MLRVIPLGGLGEVGMNCLALEQRGELMLVDCGVTFDARGLGVDVVHADFSPLDGLGRRVAGVFITHGHEDHIGALPYLLRRWDVPVWGPPYALGLVRERLHEHEVLGHAQLIETRPGQRYTVGSFEVEPIRVTHSIADATALAIKTDAGLVVHSGDFKIDDEPTDGEVFDAARLAELGDAGVTLLFSDSTNIDAEGPTGSEQSVGNALEEHVAGAPGAVVVALFASNVHRLRLLGDIAKRTGRKIVPLGRSIATHARVARSTAYLDWPSDLVMPAERCRELPRERILGLATGSQGEARAALARLASGEHPHLTIGEGDRVILSSRAIPGNEREVYNLMGQLLRRGVEVRSRVDDRALHVSGHAHRPEQRRMIELVRPRAFVPVHGTVHHMTRHAALAREVGVGTALVIENGDVLEVHASGALAKRGRVNSGRVHVFAGRTLPPAVLRERMALAESGVVFVHVVMDATRQVTQVRLVTRGVLEEGARAALLREAQAEVRAALHEAVRRADARGTWEETARLAARRALHRELGFKPVTVALIDSPP